MKTHFFYFLILTFLCAAGVVLLNVFRPENFELFSLVLSAAAALGTLYVLVACIKQINDLVLETSKIIYDGKHATKFNFGGVAKLRDHVALIQNKFNLYIKYVNDVGKDKQAERLDGHLAGDKLGDALIKMRRNLDSLHEEEKNRAWIAQGLAMFSEILRNKSEMKEYAQQIVSNLVKYLGANQAVLYIDYSNEAEGRFMEVAARYAYENNEASTRVYEGQGLIGQCMLEKEITFVTNVPTNYIKIASGLGEAQPRVIVLAPLIIKETFYGLIELALFETLAAYQIEFLKKVTENIASEIGAIKNYQKTQNLLEKSQTLTQELQIREEEMKQNVDELVSAQQQMSKKKAELDSFLSAINNTIASVEFDMEGNFVDGNDIFMRVSGYTSSELKGQSFRKVMRHDTADQMMWDNLKAGKFFSGEFKMVDVTGNKLWLTGTFNPICDEQGKPYKVMMFAQFTTQEKERSHDLSLMVNAFKSTLPVVEFNEQFVCKQGNEKFMKMFGFTRLTLREKSFHDLIDVYYQNVFEKIKEEVLMNETTSLLIPIAVNGKTLSYESTISVVRNLEGKITRIILILVREIEQQQPQPIMAAV